MSAGMPPHHGGGSFVDGAGDGDGDRDGGGGAAGKLVVVMVVVGVVSRNAMDVGRKTEAADFVDGGVNFGGFFVGFGMIVAAFKVGIFVQTSCRSSSSSSVVFVVVVCVSMLSVSVYHRARPHTAAVAVTKKTSRAVFEVFVLASRLPLAVAAAAAV